MRFPDFFIVGAPKCGTTSIFQYLKSHPGIFMSNPKEPNYYSSDVDGLWGRTSRETDYLGLFSKAPPGAVLGEASTSALYSIAAIPKILQDNPAALFIACLRNPVDMFLSYHGQMRFDLREKNEDPEIAWREHFKRLPHEPGAKLDLLDYAAMCSLGKQVQRALALTGSSRFHFILAEEITANPQATYDGVLRFLSVPSDGRTEFPVFNQRKAHVIPAIGGFVRNPPFPFNKIKNKLRALYFAAGREPPHLYHKYMTVKPPKPKIRPEFRRELIDFFSEDIGILEKATGRDLSRWRLAAAENAVDA